MAVGTVGGTLGVHRGARLCQRILGATSARELGLVVAAVGLASNLAALRALATEGIQRGHMALHRKATGEMPTEVRR
jgi:hydroxymethylglutaryl-CoA reductase